MYNGFLSKKMEFDYHLIVNRMMILLIDQLSLQLQLNQVINKSFFDKQFHKLLNQIKDLEQHKCQPPKFSNMLIPLHSIMQSNTLTIDQQKFIPPVLESDAAYSTKYSKSISTRTKSLAPSSNVKTYSPTKIHRICRPSIITKTNRLQLSDNFMDFQNESQIQGKKTPYSRDQIQIFHSPINLEEQQK